MQQIQQSDNNSTSNPSNMLKMQDVVDALEHQLTDIDQFYKFSSTNTLDQYYWQIVDSIVLNMTIMPVNQQILGLTPTDDAATVTSSVMHIADMLGHFFAKVPAAVERDIFNTMSTFPVDDTRKSRWLQHTNRLN